GAAASPAAERRARAGTGERRRQPAGARPTGRRRAAEHERSARRTDDGGERRPLGPGGEIQVERAAWTVAQTVEAAPRSSAQRGPCAASGGNQARSGGAGKAARARVSRRRSRT